MEEKYCTNCNAEFMMMESFNFCGYCKTNTLVKKSTKKQVKKSSVKKSTKDQVKTPTNKREESKKQWWQFWK